LLIGCAGDPFGDPECDRIEQVLDDLAGPSSVDCGTMERNGDPSEVDACVLKSFQNGEAFRARYEWFEIDGGGTNAWASDGTTVWWVRYTHHYYELLSYSQCLSPAVPDDTTSDSGGFQYGYRSGLDTLECADLIDGVAVCERDA
jgi:hypothetical protein